MGDQLIRCDWGQKEGLMQVYHDTEWGKPLHDDQKLFELLILEGQQAGLSWQTVLNKRENFRSALDGFNPRIMAEYDESKLALLMADAGIIRNRLKLQAAVVNARCFLKVQETYGSFDHYLWRYTDGQPILNHWRAQEDIPATTALSDQISRDMKKDGFKFVGSTIIYALMQSTGMVNDHLLDCAFRNV